MSRTVVIAALGNTDAMAMDAMGMERATLEAAVRGQDSMLLEFGTVLRCLEEACTSEQAHDSGILSSDASA